MGVVKMYWISGGDKFWFIIDDDGIRFGKGYRGFNYHTRLIIRWPWKWFGKK